MLRSTRTSTRAIRLVISESNSHKFSGERHLGTRRAVSYWTSQTPLQAAAIRRNVLIRQPQYEAIRNFHVTPPRQHTVFGALLASVLKASGAIAFATIITKVVLTFVPFVAIKNVFIRKYLKHVVKDEPEFAYKRSMLERSLRKYRISYRVLIAIPIAIFGLTFFASLERTPLSGRWRVILLSTEEEDAILKQLQGDGWYRAVLEVISEDGPPKIIPPTDWRYQVVESVLRHLEHTLPVLAAEKQIDLPWLDRGPDDLPLPPPAKYPLKPRPSAKEYIRWFCDSITSEPHIIRQRFEAGAEDVDSPHLIPGPPYNLLVIDRPDCDNAFSFGFGPDGGGGIVVYSGFINRVFGDVGPVPSSNTMPQTPGPSHQRSMVSELMGSLLAFSSPSLPASQSHQPPTRIHSEPTEEQIAQLAILLSHELAHLILSHHLESLSASTIFIPGTVSIFSDLLRALLFPVTMIFGPFVNDAVAEWGRTGAQEFAKISECCTSMALEFEADAVSARILAHAGFDARETISFWERRQDASLSECPPSRAAENARYFDSRLGSTRKDLMSNSLGARLARKLMSVTHPTHEARLSRLKSELQRWETERAKALRKRAKKLLMKQICPSQVGEREKDMQDIQHGHFSAYNKSRGPPR